MANSRVISACVVLAVVASGCGGSKTTTTSTVASAPSINTATGTATGTATQGTSPTTTQKASPPPQSTQTKAAPKIESKARDRKVKAYEQANKALFKAKAKPIPPTPTHLPRSRRFPEAVQETFLAQCQVGKGSPSLCKCVLAKQELRPIERLESVTEARGRSIAETLILGEALLRGTTVDQALRHAVPLPRRVRGALATCKGA
jgi:hypothetical protein